ncbi:MAG: hypothetical protein V3T82_09160 [Nitrospinaceae bacterium]
MTTIDPTPIIIPDIILNVPIWDGAVIGGITTLTISIGATISRVIITKTTPMAINGAINVTAMVSTIETIIGGVTMDANGDDKLIVRTGGKVGRAN